MPYTEIDFPSKKVLKEAFAAGKVIRVYQPGPFGPAVRDGEVTLEGPHYPKPHRWYARASVKDGIDHGRDSMRGFATNAFTGDSTSVYHEAPRPTDETFREKAANRRKALFLGAVGEGATVYLEGEFEKGIATIARKLTAAEAALLIAGDVAYHCQECNAHDGRVRLHLYPGKFLADVEREIGYSKNVAGDVREK